MTKIAYTVSIEPEDVEKLSELAKKKDLPPRTLARIFILKGLRNEISGSGDVQ